MSERAANVLGGVSGLLFLVLVVVGFGVLVAGTPPLGADEDDVVEFLDKTPWRVWLGGYVELLGFLFFIVFVTRLWAILRAAEDGSGWLATTALAAALVSVAIALAVTLAAGGGAYASGRDGADPEVVRALLDVRNVGRSVSVAVDVLFLAAAATVILRTGVLPRWLGAAGAALAAGGLVAVPVGAADTLIMLLALWVVATGALMVSRRERLTAV